MQLVHVAILHENAITYTQDCSSSFKHSHWMRGASPELNARIFREEKHRSRTGGSAGLLRSAAHQTDCRPTARIHQPASALLSLPPAERERERELVIPLVALYGSARTEHSDFPRAARAQTQRSCRRKRCIAFNAFFDICTMLNFFFCASLMKHLINDKAFIISPLAFNTKTSIA